MELFVIEHAEPARADGLWPVEGEVDFLDAEALGRRAELGFGALGAAAEKDGVLACHRRHSSSDLVLVAAAVSLVGLDRLSGFMKSGITSLAFFFLLHIIEAYIRPVNLVGIGPRGRFSSFLNPGFAPFLPLGGAGGPKSRPRGAPGAPPSPGRGPPNPPPGAGR